MQIVLVQIDLFAEFAGQAFFCVATNTFCMYANDLVLGESNATRVCARVSSFAHLDRKKNANRSHQQCKLYFGVFNGVIKMQVM